MTRRGFFRILRWCGCAVTLGGFRCPVLPFDPISLVLAQRNGVEPPKKSALKPPRHLGGPARLSHLGISPNGTNWCVKLVCTRWANWPGKVSLTQSAVMLGLRVRGRGGRDRTAPVAAPLSAFLWGSTPFLCARAKKWGGIGSREERLPPKKTAPPHPPPTSTSPLQKSGEERPVYRGSSAHANGGAAGVKKALFFGGSTPFLWASTKEMGSNGSRGHRPPPNVSAHTHKSKKGGTPGEGSPLDPLLRFYEQKESSALCGARPGTLSLDPATFEKVAETFKRASRSAYRAAI